MDFKARRKKLLTQLAELDHEEAVAREVANAKLAGTCWMRRGGRMGLGLDSSNWLYFMVTSARGKTVTCEEFGCNDNGYFEFFSGKATETIDERCEKMSFEDYENKLDDCLESIRKNQAVRKG